MWTDLIVEEIHQTRACITQQAGDDSHALTLAVQEIATAAAAKFGVTWKVVPSARQATPPEANRALQKQ